MKLVDYYRLRRRMAGLPCVIKEHHERIAEAEEKLMLGLLPTPNLMILMPPRCSKTTLANETFLSYSHSHFPDSESIISSYSADLATASAMEVRADFAADWYRDCSDSTWGVRLPMRGTRAGGRQDYFWSEQGGSVKAVGTGGGITGFGAGKLREEFGGVIMVDDPIKAQDAIKSPTVRAAAWDYIQKTLATRRNRSDTPMVLIMQRLHPEDPAGMLLREERDLWTTLQLQAHLPDGRSIWEERISAASLELMREADPDKYWSQYQQNPAQSARAIFRETWWNYWCSRAEMERRLTLKIITADTAFSAKDSADWSVFQCWGFEGISGAYLVDQFRGRWEFPELLQQARAFVKKHTESRPGVTPATEMWVEDKASGISLVQTLRKEGIPARPWEPNDKTAPDKVARAKQCTLPIAAGRVFLPDPEMPGYGWVRGFVNEHSAFTDDDSHLNDDQVDGETEALLIWMQRGGGTGPLPTWADGWMRRAQPDQLTLAA